MGTNAYRDYLKSADWQQKRQAKRRKRNHCAICGSTKQLDVHHLRYRQDLTTVPQADLRVLCRQCHETAHALMKSGMIRFRSVNPHHRFQVTCNAVRKARRIGAWSRKDSLPAPVVVEPPPETITETLGWDWLVTEAWIDEYRTPKGGWKAKQLAALDVTWPPANGWKKRAVGMTISNERRLTFEAFARTK